MWTWCRTLPPARKCCCCVPVRTGVIIFGYVNLVVWLLMFPLLVYMVAEAATRAGGAGGAGGLQLPLTAGCVLLDAALTVVLLVGAHQKRRALLCVYVCGGACALLAALALLLLYLPARAPTLSALLLIFLGVNLYLLYLVWSLWEVLRARGAAPPPLLEAPPAAPAPRSRDWRYVMQRASDASDTAPAH